MTLSDLADLSTILSSIAVTLSLIYLALQVQQNTKHTKALIRQGRAARVVGIMMGEADADMATAVIIANGGQPTPEAIKRAQFEGLAAARIVSFEESFAQYEMGLMSEDGLKMTRVQAARIFGQPGFREAWSHYKQPGTKFTAFIDDEIAKLPAAAH